jgi:hypothetical protein
VLQIVLMYNARAGRALVRTPTVLGEYWAYVFPLTAVAIATVRYAADEGSVPAAVLAWAEVCIALLALCIVFARMSWHHLMVLRGKETWNDPLLQLVRTQVSPAEPPDAATAADVSAADDVQPTPTSAEAVTEQV